MVKITYTKEISAGVDSSFLTMVISRFNKYRISQAYRYHDKINTYFLEEGYCCTVFRPLKIKSIGEAAKGALVKN
jgi:hypothetical protein